MAVYPNPTKDILNISMPQINGNATLKLFDIQGRQVLETTTNSKNEVLHIGNLQGGIYMLTIENENNKINKKIVLNK